MKIDIASSAASAYYNQPAWDPLIKTDVFDPLTEKMGRKPSCCECSTPHCCNQTILCSMYEGLAMAHVVKLSGMDSTEFRKKLDCRDELMQTETIWQHFTRKLPCVFLNERGLCSIYQARPEICRTFLTWRKPEECTDIETESGNVTIEGKQNRLQISMLLSCMSLQKSWGLPYETPLIGTLPGTVLCALLAWDKETDEERAKVITGFQWVSDARAMRILGKEPMFNASDFLALMTGGIAR